MKPFTVEIRSQEDLDRHVADTPDRYVRAIEVPDARADIKLPSSTWYVYGKGTVRASAGRVHTNDTAHAFLTGRAHGYANEQSMMDVSGDTRAEIRDNAYVDASGSAQVDLADSATGTIRECAQADLDGSARATVRDTASVTCIGLSEATLHDGARGTFYGRTRFTSYGSSLAVADGTVTGDAYETSTVIARDRANTDIYGDASVHVSWHGLATCYGAGRVMVGPRGTAIIGGDVDVAPSSVVVEADNYVLANTVSRRLTLDATLVGGRPRDAAGVRFTEAPSGREGPEQWLRAYSEESENGGFIVYKALGPDLVSGARYRKPLTWPLEGEVSLNDTWEDTEVCGHGLHLSPTPNLARYHLDALGWRVLRCSVSPEDVSVLRSLVPQIKARKVRVLEEISVKEWF